MRPDFSVFLRRYGPGAVLEDHHHGRGSVSVVIGGTVEERVGGNEALGRIGDVVVKPAGVVHSNRFGPQGAVLVSIAEPPRSAFEQGWRWFGSMGFARSALAAAAALRKGDPFGAAHDMAWELLECVGGGESRRCEATIAPWLRDVRDAVAGHPGRPSVSRLAERANVHPVYLTRAFRAAFGRSISGFIRKLRSERAADLLARSDLNIGAVAAALGFADQSHLCRAFRAELGISPSDYRALVTRGSAPRLPCSGSR
jgi:AraC family transcriptional regulator